MPDPNSRVSQFTAVSRERHAGKKWLHSNGYAFAAADALAPLVGAELVRAAVSMPCAFLEQSGRYTLVAVLSLVPGRNMCVGPDGRWLLGYIPAWFRTYPFRLVPQQGTDKAVLCVDEGSGLVVEDNAAGEDFFAKDGNIPPALKTLFDLLTHVESNRRVTERAVSALAEAGVIAPWPIKLKTEQGEKAISGLHRIDEAALNALPDDVFLKLRTALPIAYGQLLAAGQLGIFEHLAKLHNQPAPLPVAALPESLDSLFGVQNDDMIRFN
jgi:hypothetical protein